MNSLNVYHAIINNLRDGVYFVDRDRRITLWNKAAEDITGFAKDEIIGQLCQSNLLNHIDKAGQQLCLFGCPLHATLLDGKQRIDEVLLRHKEGHRIPVLVNIFPISEDGEIVGAVEIFTPKTPIVYDDNLIDMLSNMALTDPLTRIANRRKMESYLEYRYHEYERFERKFCVVFFDVDNFSDFNNKYGHDAGDCILKSIAKSISHCMRASDLVARWGGEEFISVHEVKNNAEATLVAEKIRVLVEKTEVPYEDLTLSVTVSVGVAVCKTGDTIESLLRRADALMYQSKNNGKNLVTADISLI